MCLGRTVAFSTIKKWLPFKRAHIEQMRGTPSDSRNYCMKEDPNPFEFGRCPTTGTKLLDQAVIAVRAGSTLRDLANKSDEGARAVVVHGRGLSTLSNLTAPSRDPGRPPHVFWLHGSTGTGKTRCAFELGRDFNHGEVSGVCIIADPGLSWFEPYDKQPVAVFDDFRAKGVKFNWLLRVLDRYPLQVPVKGGFVNWNPQCIFITTPRTPLVTFETRNVHKPEDVEQLVRRLTRVVDFDDAGEIESFREFFRTIIPERPVQASEETPLPDGGRGTSTSPDGGGADNLNGGRVDLNGSLDRSGERSRRDLVEAATTLSTLWRDVDGDSSNGIGSQGSCGAETGEEEGGEEVIDSDLELLGSEDECIDESDSF